METAKKAIVQVGHGGRGFIVGARDRFVVTAAHCVPIEHIPTPDMSNGPEQLTFPNIIGPLGETPTIWCELCAYGLTDDIAAFCEPEVDDQDQYVKFTDAAAFAVGNPPAIGSKTSAFVLSLDGKWKRCTVNNGGRFLHISGPDRLIESGMSGSPIVDENGAAIGVVSIGSGPSLIDCLPAWLLRKLGWAE
jgi:hypothetical protein